MDGIEGRQCVYIGEYIKTEENEQSYILNMLGRTRKNQIQIIRDSIVYDVEICLMANKKKIKVIADKESSLKIFYSIIMEILRFENLFEGMFFPLVSWKVDEMECANLIKRVQLAYYDSQKQYIYFSIHYNDMEYRKLFLSWRKIEKQNKIIHPVFLFSTYLKGMPVDIRMALLLETFEPIADGLEKQGIIKIQEEIIVKKFKEKCKKCGEKLSITKEHKKKFFAKKIKALIELYGKEIFDEENKMELIAKAV